MKPRLLPRLGHCPSLGRSRGFFLAPLFSVNPNSSKNAQKNLWWSSLCTFDYFHKVNSSKCNNFLTTATVLLLHKMYFDYFQKNHLWQKIHFPLFQNLLSILWHVPICWKIEAKDKKVYKKFCWQLEKQHIFWSTHTVVTVTKTILGQNFVHTVLRVINVYEYKCCILNAPWLKFEGNYL